MNKYKKLVNNSIILTIGNFGSKLISFFMIPLYTNLLTTSEYGLVDLIITTRSLLVPFLTLELGQAALRFAIDSKSGDERNMIFSNISLHGLIVSGLLLLVSPVLSYFEIFEDNILVYFILLLILSMINNLYSQYIRGIGLVKEFAINGVLMTFVTVTSNFILLVFFKLGISGYLMSLVLATFISNIYLLFSEYKSNQVRKITLNMEIMKKMLRFSIPIIPNSAMWWVISGSARYFILYFVGTSANGLYAVANKIPSIISMVTGIFSQAWQLSSFEEYGSKDQDFFYTQIFNIYSSLLFLAGSSILVFLKPILGFLVEYSFYRSWTIVPFLLLAVIYQSFSSFLGTNYTAAKKTKGAFSTSIYGGIISLVTSLILVPLIGVIGAGVSSALSFFSMFLIRLVDSRKYVKIDISFSRFFFSNLVFIIQTGVLFITDGILLIFIELILLIIMVLANRETLVKIFRVFLKGINKII